MVQVHVTEAEAARDFHAVLARVREGVEVVVEQENRAIAVIRMPTPPGPDRSIDECIAIAEAFEARPGYAPLPDEDFARDVQAGIDGHREPLDPPAPRPGRLLSECIALAEAHARGGEGATLDDEFGKDLEEVIAGRREPLMSRWD
jgi:antitoxin (DNA-binding transcriptional repressor) of toxin-antitoxin stability system